MPAAADTADSPTAGERKPSGMKITSRTTRGSGDIAEPLEFFRRALLEFGLLKAGNLFLQHVDHKFLHR